MLFNSYLFLFAFLPVTVIVYYLLTNRSKYHAAAIWLITSSLVFYGWFNPWYAALISGSILINYLAGKLLAAQMNNRQKAVLICGITFNILLLGYFKYANFFLDNVNAIFTSNFHLDAVILPLALSFFTLQQISYLADIFHDKATTGNFLEYCLFVSFFPKLISGPIVRYQEMMPQIKSRMPVVTMENLAVGVTILAIGLFKKVILADNLGVFVTPVFDAALNNSAITFLNGWSGALSYAFQLYFDFSGYCDMAIGIGLLFGIKLPINFYSPYRSSSIIDFWRRWHITLSRFLRDYLYIPLGGNRKGLPRQMVNLLLVMTIAGLWHGAGWTFIIWGAIHGFYLLVNHGWRNLRQKTTKKAEKASPPVTMVSVFFTFIAVTIAWVFFRAENIGAAIGILKGMVGINGIVLSGIPYTALVWITISLVICWFLPNSLEYVSKFNPAFDHFTGKARLYPRWLQWNPVLWKTIVIAGMVSASVLFLSRVNQFIYFQF
jgi:alginate O-acetyltransferase complex protein AlgI